MGVEPEKEKPKEETIETIEDLKRLLSDLNVPVEIVEEVDLDIALRELKRKAKKAKDETT